MTAVSYKNTTHTGRIFVGLAGAQRSIFNTEARSKSWQNWPFRRYRERCWLVYKLSDIMPVLKYMDKSLQLLVKSGW